MENKIKTVVPTLRFPEFRGTEGWEMVLIGNIGETYGGLTGKNKTDFGNGKKYITYKQVYNYSFVDITHCDFVCINASEKQNHIKFGDILFTQSSETPEEVGISSVMLDKTNETIYLNSFCFGLRPFDLKKISPYFSKYLFRSQIFRDRIIPLAQGITRFNISPTKFKTIKIPIPTSIYNDQENTEQQKIADCLSSLDDLIEATTKKVEALKEHKKGLMQRLFPAKGKNVPDLRFPEFQGTSVWEEKKLGKIGNFIGGGTPNTTNPEYWDGEILWYTPTEIKNGYLKSSNRKITKQGLKNSSAKLLPKGAILITTRATIGDVAISKKECTTNQGFQSLVVNDSEINLFWFYWIIQHKEELIKKASGSTFKEIGKNEIINIIAYSAKKQEQQKIADCLSSIDELIEATTRKIEVLKEHKKGLMQQLFPKI